MQNFLSGVWITLLLVVAGNSVLIHQQNETTRASVEAARTRLEAAQISQARAEAACITLTQVLENGPPRTQRMTP